MVGADGSGGQQLTRDGRSLYPVWGPDLIAFDHERLRERADPAYALWVMSPEGARPRQLARTRVPPLHEGLVPLGFSADGAKLLAEYVGADTSRAWSVEVGAAHARQLLLSGHSVSGAAISRDGRQLHVDRGGYLNPPDDGIVEAMPFGGGSGRTLIQHGSDPSWNL